MGPVVSQSHASVLPGFLERLNLHMRFLEVEAGGREGKTYTVTPPVGDRQASTRRPTPHCACVTWEAPMLFCFGKAYWARFYLEGGSGGKIETKGRRLSALALLAAGSYRELLI